MNALNQHCDDNIGLLRQGIEAIGLLGAERYAGAGLPPGLSPIGAHVRHVLEHYRMFLEGMVAGAVDYDARSRDRRLEVEPEAAVAAAEVVIGALGTIPATRLAAPITVTANVVRDGSSVPEWTGTTVQRELMYLLSHTVHHYALISLLARDLGVALPADFGVAPSTLAHRRAAEACAR